MKKTLILILVVLMALFAFTVISADDGDTPIDQVAETVADAAVIEAAEEPADEPAASSDQEPAEPEVQSEDVAPGEPQSGSEDAGEGEIEVSGNEGENSGETPTEVSEPAATDNTDTAAPAEGTSDEPQTPAESTPADTDTIVTEGTTNPEGTGTDTTGTTENAEPTAETPAEENATIYMTVTITGNMARCQYNPDDASLCTADGFSITAVSCSNEKGEPVNCPVFGEKDLHFTGTAHAELPMNSQGTTEMELNGDQFELDLNAENVTVSFEIIKGSVEVYDESTEGGVIDQTGTEEPTETPADTGTEEPAADPETQSAEPEPEFTQTVEEETGYKVYTGKHITIRVIVTPDDDEEEPAADPVADEEETEKIDEEAEEKTAEDLNTEKDEKNDETNELNSETNEETDENSLEEETEPAEKTGEEAEELTEPGEGEEQPAETGEEEFQTVVSDGDTAAVEETDPEAEAPAEEESEQPEEEADAAPKSISFTEGMVIYDAEGEPLELSLEEGAELTILSVDEETGLAQVQLPDGTTAYVQMPAEEVAEEEVIAIRSKADGLSTIISSLIDDSDFTVLSVEGDWVLVELPDGTKGYVFIDDIEFEGKPEKIVTEKKVTIFSSIHSMMHVNEPIILTSLLEGFEDCVEITYQWECNKGNGFEAVDGANSDTYIYEATANSLTWSWQLVVNYK